MFDSRDQSDSRFGDEDPSDPDFQSIEAFVEAWMDDGEEVFTRHQLACLAWNLKRSRRSIRRELESYGLRLEARGSLRRFRTVGDNPHDRWYGPGSCPTHGGSGWEQITGFAGVAG